MKTTYKTLPVMIALLGAITITQQANAQSQENPFRRSAALAAREGGVQGGGGDTKTELRIKAIRDDLMSWIVAGGSKGLAFKNRITLDDYLNGNQEKAVFGMIDILAPGAVVVNAIKANEQRLDDQELNTYVNGMPKVCKSWISERDARPHMLCEIERFKELSESEQYQQVHHEYAGLGLLEKNSGSDSDYSLSSQITDYLIPSTVLRLAVKPWINPDPAKVNPRAYHFKWVLRFKGSTPQRMDIGHATLYSDDIEKNCIVLRAGNTQCVGYVDSINPGGYTELVIVMGSYGTAALDLDLFTVDDDGTLSQFDDEQFYPKPAENRNTWYIQNVRARMPGVTVHECEELGIKCSN